MESPSSIPAIPVVTNHDPKLGICKHGISSIESLDSECSRAAGYLLKSHSLEFPAEMKLVSRHSQPACPFSFDSLGEGFSLLFVNFSSDSWIQIAICSDAGQ
jgi:hypothetical protein